MLILGIESSCDETAAAIVSSDRKILSNIVWLQTLQDIDAIAATAGPGLIGGVIVGVMTAKAMASVLKKPFIAVNHLEGHALTVRLTEDAPFPYLLLLASGGHCQFLIVSGVGQYQKLGGTMDDALGEAFDKTAKMLGLGYPGGAMVEKMALLGDERAYKFPVPLRGRAGCDFSFSGLKTAVRLQIEKNLSLRAESEAIQQQKCDICASFQYTATLSVLERAEFAILEFKKLHPDAKYFVLAGGVAANQYIREKLQNLLKKYDLQLLAPPIKLCTDNAAMIAWAGIEKFRLGQSDSLDFEPRARWALG